MPSLRQLNELQSTVNDLRLIKQPAAMRITRPLLRAWRDSKRERTAPHICHSCLIARHDLCQQELCPCIHRREQLAFDLALRQMAAVARMPMEN